jgi:tetratricopeptide (TPR) repeat protein
MEKTQAYKYISNGFDLIVFHLLFATSMFAQDGLQQARDLIKMNQPQEAKTILVDLLKNNPSNDQVLFTLGRAYMSLRDMDSSIVFFEKAVSSKNDSANYHFWLGQAYGMKALNANILKRAGPAKKAKQAYENAVTLDPGHTAARIQLAQYYLRVPLFLGGSREKAFEQIQSILPVRPFVGKMLLAWYYQQENQDSLVHAEYQDLMKQYGDSSRYIWLHNSYGYFLLRQKLVLDAIVVFEKWTVLEPKNANAYDSLGDGYRAAGRLEEASSAHRKALEIDPAHAPSKKNLSEVEKQIAKAPEK